MEKDEGNADSSTVNGDATNGSSESSLTLSLTPPLSGTLKNDESSISEHLSSIENDRSYEEIEVGNLSLHLSQEPRPSFNSSYNSTSSSINTLETNVKSILEEILNNDQFKSDGSSREESIDIFANLNLDNAMLNSYNLEKSTDFDLIHDYGDVSKRVEDFEELLAIKDTTIAALTQEVDSLRDNMMSNPSSNSLGTSTTEYKQYQEECHNKLLDYHNAIVEKDDLIKKLTESLHQSVLNRQELKQQTEHFKNEIAQLQKQLEETCEMLRTQNPPHDSHVDCSQFEGTLNPAQMIQFQTIKAQFGYGQSKSDLIDKHSQEMEELRTYFEKKCADFEKNYSEEVFSQQSRKMSGSSSCSDVELPSDFVFNQPGPGGDSNLVRDDYSRKDLDKLRLELEGITALLANYDISKLSDEDFADLKGNLRKFDFKSFIKFDLSEIQNKYHAELEILREDYDNRLDELKLKHENDLVSVENKYLEEIEELYCQIRANTSQMASTAIQEVASSGEFEIDEVVQSYERRLQEQVTLAKIDIIGALENKIQGIDVMDLLPSQLLIESAESLQRLASSETIDDDWPDELLKLKDRFAEKYLIEIESLKSSHELEIAQLKEDHLRTLNSALERARRRSLLDADSVNKGELELVKERDNLKKQTLTLRNSIGELLKYFTQCEDELNNTLVDELLRQSFDHSTVSTPTNEQDLDITRVHLAPNVNDLLNAIDSSNSNDYSSDLESLDLRGELGSCLKKLKADANAVLALSTNVGNTGSCNQLNSTNQSNRNSIDNRVSSLTRQLIDETRIKNELIEELKDVKLLVQSLESERIGLEMQLDQVVDRQKVVEEDLATARSKIAELIENGHREIVSEGYGEGVRGWVDVLSTLSDVQEKARTITDRPDNKNQVLLNLIEEFARVSEKIVEEAKKERDDFKQQIDAADNKYKITCQFLEDQAAEREQERDESQKEIDRLRERLRNRDKERASCERYTSEVEQLELQVDEKTRQIDEIQRRCEEIEIERKEAIDKVYVLRDIIRSLELQVENKTKAEDDLRVVISELEVLIKNQVRSDGGGDSTRNESNFTEDECTNKMHRHIGDLEGEVQRLRLSQEIAGSEGAIKQIRNHLSEFETTLDKRTKDLEGFHSTVSTTCSSPSEEMSIRDVVNQSQPQSSIYEECEVPLQQLARLREKLVRHSRAEDAALKRIRDFEMQVYTLKNDLDENHSEREILKKQIQDQLVLISSLQIRLDDQRIRAEHIEKQTNTSLEVKIYDLQTIVTSLEEKITTKDKTIAHLEKIIEETKKRLRDKENELNDVKTNEILSEMQAELERLRSDNDKLKARMRNEARIVPNLVENIISDKNNDIELLREKLAESERLLEAYNALSLDKSQLDALNRLRLSGVSFVDLIDGPDPPRRMEMIDESMQKSQSINKNDSGSEEISKIDKVGPSHFFTSLQTPIGRQNSTEKHVRFEDDVEICNLRTELANLKESVMEYEERLKTLDDLEVKVLKMQEIIDKTEAEVKKTQNELEESEKDFKLQLAAKRLDADEKDDEINGLNRDVINYQAQLAQKVALLTETVQENSNLKTLNSDLAREVDHLQHLLVEKEKVIGQMADDSRSLQINLETIQRKMKESGNVLDLARRLRDEQKKNWDLVEEVHTLKAQLLIGNKSMDNIASDVQKELKASLEENRNFDSIMNELERFKSINSNLEQVTGDLKTKLAEARSDLDRVRSDDGKLIEQLRLSLDAALNDRNRMENQLDEIKSIKSRSESTEYKDLDNVEVKSLKEHNDHLNNQLKSLSRAKIDVESKLKYAQDLMESKNEEIRGLQEKIDVFMRNESRIQEKLYEIKTKYDEKTKEVENSRVLIDEMDSDRLTMKKQIDGLYRRLKDALESSRGDDKSNQLIPDKLMDKIRELNGAVKDNMQMVDLIARLTSEKATLEERIVALEHGNVANFPFEDPQSRANYLFAKYLRSESYRKALVWQKRYLQSLLWSCQEMRGDRQREGAKNRFKRVIWALIAISRMKFMVKRWHSGKRIIRTTVNVAQFHVGKPVSSQNFALPPAPPGDDDKVEASLPWCGTSPPSKETTRMVRPNQRGEPLTAPGLLTKYVERFNQIQEKLGMASDPVG